MFTQNGKGKWINVCLWLCTCVHALINIVKIRYSFELKKKNGRHSHDHVHIEINQD